MNAVDLFAGPGGWDVGARELGLDPLGIELDDAACRVREAAGLRTVQGDVAALDPLDFPCDLLIASPPCTAFSMAGKGEGRGATDDLTEAIRAMGRGEPVDQVALDEACADSTAHLVLEPLRWALALDPVTVCCEQVPPVLPLWEAMAEVLTDRGYFTWTGIVSSEQFGVPQTRKRAFLIASKHHPVGEPAGTHQRYVAPRNRDDEGGGLFDLPDAQRVVARGDEHLTPWVSMAEALGWGMNARPSVTVAAGANRTGGPAPLDGGSGARSTIERERVIVGFPRRADNDDATDDGYRSRDFRSIDRPADTVTEKARSWVMRANANACVRGVDLPAPTITAGHDSGDRVWTVGRPATTIAGDPRVFQPGGHKEPGEQSQNAIRVTEAQAACLQGFPDGYPWAAAGSRSAAFRCIGNAVPPPMARAVLAEALGPNRCKDAA